MIGNRLFAAGILAAMPMIGWSYDSGFTLTFEQATDTDGWADLATPTNTEIFAGEDEAVDNPPYATPPEDALHFNGTNWLRLGAAGNAFGVGTYSYDGRAGGASTEVLNFVATADVYVNPQAGHRFQVALFGRWTQATGTAPFEVFYSRNTPGTEDGFGWRHGGVTAVYNAFPTTTVTGAQWVRMRLEMNDTTAIVSIDENLDNTYEHVSPELTVTTAVNPGKIGFQLVLNDPDNGSVAVPNKFAYFDNLDYVPLASIPEWSLY